MQRHRQELRHGNAAQDFTVLDTFRKNRMLKPAGSAELNEGGLALARALPNEVAEAADGLVTGGGPDA